MKQSPRLIRITTVPVSLLILLKGQMRYMREKGFEVIMISSPGVEAQLAEEQEMCQMITIPMERGVHFFRDLVTLFRLYRLLKKLNPDIVHTHTPKAGLLGMLAARICGVPVRLHTIAGLPWMERKGAGRMILKQMERVTAWASHRVYPNSYGLKVFIEQELKVPSNKLKLLGKGSSNGIDCSYFDRENISGHSIEQLRSRAGISENCFVWIFVGRLVKEKGVSELVKAFMRLVKLFPEDQLWLVGIEEPERDPLPLKTRNCLYQNPSIVCWGFQADVRPFFAASSVLVFPSYREGFPNVPLQAGAMQVPMILSDINGCNELIENGTTGILVPPKSAEALYEAMYLLRKDELLRNKLAKSNRNRILESYHQQNVWENLYNEYQSFFDENIQQ